MCTWVSGLWLCRFSCLLPREMIFLIRFYSVSSSPKFSYSFLWVIRLLFHGVDRAGGNEQSLTSDCSSISQWFHLQSSLQMPGGFREERLQEQAFILFYFIFLLEAPRMSPSYTNHARSLAIHSKYLAATSHLPSVLHMVMYICWCSSLHSSHLLPPPMCPQVRVLHLHLHSFPANRAHQCHFSGFHIYVLIDWGTGGWLMRKGIYAWLWLVHIVVWQKATQYCKSEKNKTKKISCIFLLV